MSAKRASKGPDGAPASFDESHVRLEAVVGELEEGGRVLIPAASVTERSK